MRTISYLLAIALFVASCPVGQAQVDHFSYEKSKWPLNQVFHYSKANWDGSNKGFVSVFFKDHDWLEAIKWHEGHAQATLVPAKIDHQTFNVIHFKNFRCQEGDCRQLGEMYWDEEIEGFIMQLGEMTDTVVNIPSYWHSYDFDFNSLMAAFLFKENPESHTFQRADFIEVDGNFIFGPIGKIRMSYQGVTRIDNANCHLYKIDGPGLNHKGGEIWFDQQMLLRGFRIEEPDESSYQNIDYKFLKQERMSTDAWEAFKREKYNQ